MGILYKNLCKDTLFFAYLQIYLYLCKDFGEKLTTNH